MKKLKSVISIFDLVILSTNQKNSIEYYNTTITNSIVYYKQRIIDFLNESSNPDLQKVPIIIRDEMKYTSIVCANLLKLFNKDILEIINQISPEHITILQKAFRLYSKSLEKGIKKTNNYIITDVNLKKEQEDLDKIISAFSED